MKIEERTFITSLISPSPPLPYPHTEASHSSTAFSFHREPRGIPHPQSGSPSRRDPFRDRTAHPDPVSYTHLDVYKRQTKKGTIFIVPLNCYRIILPILLPWQLFLLCLLSNSVLLFLLYLFLQLRCCLQKGNVMAMSSQRRCRWSSFLL